LHDASFRDFVGAAVGGHANDVAVEDDEVSRLAHVQRPGILVDAQHAGAIDGVRGDRFVDSEILT
jgi:hypothetical protein